MNKTQFPTDVSIISAYRWQMRCKMCNIWKYPSDEFQKITPKDLEKLPSLKFVNIIRGEPFQRRDLEDIVAISFEKVPRVVISTSGWHYERIIALAKNIRRLASASASKGYRNVTTICVGVKEVLIMD